ncbi:MAG: type II secretion system protein [Halioglobus sp.]
MISSRSVATRARGFSLLEMVVAVAILGISLGALYRAAGGAVRIVALDEKSAYAVELARSLLANYAVVPLAGIDDTGETEGGFAWEVVAEPAPLPDGSTLAEGSLQHITVAVSWQDGARERNYTLESVVAGQEKAP